MNKKVIKLVTRMEAQIQSERFVCLEGLAFR
jgi:hypothetical protein